MKTTDWLGFSTPFNVTPPTATIGATLDRFLTPAGAAEARERTTVHITQTAAGLRLHAECYTAAMDRVRAIQRDYGRDNWGDDALEIQIDVGRTRREYFHIIIPPTGRAVTYRGYNNRLLQGWHPPLEVTVTFHADRWTIDALLPFTGHAGAVWGFNVMRTNPSEAAGYVQWTPTFGGADRVELFGTLQFGKRGPATRQAEIDRYRQRAELRQAHFQNWIHQRTDQDVTAALRTTKRRPVPVRWDGLVVATDRAFTLALANKFCRMNDGSYPIHQFEVLADAFALTGKTRYIETLRTGVAAYTESIKTAPPDGPLYGDWQVVLDAIMAYACLTADAVTPAVLRSVLRSARNAALSVTTCYNAGNHQIFEAMGLGLLAVYFPQFKESDRWATISSRCIARHLQREVGSDGAYFERCGYHSVAMSFTGHLVATIRANRDEKRFRALMSPATLQRLQKMYKWMLAMVAPDWTMPAFGDHGAYSQYRFFQPPPPLRTQSVSFPKSQFTVMRNRDFYMAVDHGPLGGQHSHVDNMGFVAYAYGRPVALDAGIGAVYSDPRYNRWFRTAQAHNVVVVDDAQPEKLSERVSWRSTQAADFLVMRSRGYEYSHGVIHERTIIFVKTGYWFIHDRLIASGEHRYTWLLHTPVDLRPAAVGRWAGTGLVVLSTEPGPAVIERKPSAVPLPRYRKLRLMDARLCYEDKFTADIPALALTKVGVTTTFATVLLPNRGRRQQATLTQDGTAYRITRARRCDVVRWTTAGEIRLEQQ